MPCGESLSRWQAGIHCHNGPIRSGKSSAHILGCLDRPTSGELFIENQDIQKATGNQLAEIRNRKIGFVFRPSICFRKRLP